MAHHTLAHDLVLLSYDDEGVNRLGRPTLDHGLAGALLMELTLAGRVVVTDGRLTVTDATPMGQRQLDEALQRIAATPRRRRPREWVARLAKALPEQILDGLVTAGVLRREADKVLWVFPRTRYPSSTGFEPTVETEARQRMLAAITGDGPVDPRTAALLGLVKAVGLHRTLFRDLPKDRVKRRLAEIDAGDWAAEATRKAIQDTQAAVLATTTATAGAIVVTTTT